MGIKRVRMAGSEGREATPRHPSRQHITYQMHCLSRVGWRAAVLADEDGVARLKDGWRQQDGRSTAAFAAIHQQAIWVVENAIEPT